MPFQLKSPRFTDPVQRQEASLTYQRLLFFFCVVINVLLFALSLWLSEKSKNFAVCEPMRLSFVGLYITVASSAMMIALTLISCCAIAGDMSTRRRLSCLNMRHFMISIIVVSVLDLGSTIYSFQRAVGIKGDRSGIRAMMNITSNCQETLSCLNGIQTRFSCCGVFSYDEWLQPSSCLQNRPPELALLLPSSCACDPLTRASCIPASLNGTNVTVISTGCLATASGELIEILETIALITFIVCLIQGLVVLVIAYAIFKLNSRVVIGTLPPSTNAFHAPASESQLRDLSRYANTSISLSEFMHS